MKGIIFYLEYPNKKEKNRATRKNPGNHSGNCLAVLSGTGRVSGNGICFDAMGAVQDIPNNSVCTTAVSQGYLRENCKRISEKMAGGIHPELINRLK